MNVLHIVILVATLFATNLAYATNYKFPGFKSGAKADLESLFDNANNYVLYNSKAYLKANQTVVNTLNTYGVVEQTTLENPIGISEQLVSLKQTGASYYQCVQFVKALSDIGWTGGWHKGVNLNKNMFIRWRFIAKFQSDGTYNGSNGGHVAIAVTSNSNGVVIIDQNYDGDDSSDYGKIAYHVIPWSSAVNYSLVEIPE